MSDNTGNFYGIELGIQIDQKSLKNIGTQIDGIIKQFKSKKIVVDIDFGNTGEAGKAMGGMGGQIPEMEKISDVAAKIVTNFDAAGKPLTQIITSTKTLGKEIQHVYDVTKEDKEIIISAKLTENIESAALRMQKFAKTTEDFSAKMQKSIVAIRGFGSDEQRARLTTLLDRFNSLSVSADSTQIEFNETTQSAKLLANEIMVLGNAIAKTQQQQIANAKTYATLDTRIKKMKASMQSATNVVEHFGSPEQRKQMQAWNSELHKLNITSDMTEGQMKSMANHADILKSKMSGLRDETRATGKGALRLGDMIKTAAKAFTVWISVTTLWFGAIRKIKEGIQTVTELDSALLEVNKVMDLTAEQMKYLTERAFELGESLAQTGIEVVQATADFGRMGYGLEEALDLAEQATLLLNIGDGIESIDTATKAIIATLKGFAMEAGNASHIVDVLNEVSNNYAVDTNDLAEGIRRAAAVLAQSNTTFEESIGLITAATEVIQDAEKASTGIRTISQRLRSLDEEGESLGDSFVPKLQKAFKTIAGVDIMIGGKLRSTYEILRDTAAVWDDLSEEQQQYLGELAAGKRRINIFNAIMSNQETLLNATKSAYQSLGSAVEENAKVVDSIKGKVDIFNNAVQEMWTNLINSQSVKFFVDLGTAIIKVTDYLGLLNIVFAAFVVYLTITNKFGIADFFMKMGRAIYMLIAPTTSATVAMGGLTIATEALYAALTMGIAVAITAIITLISRFIKTQKAARIEAEEYAKALEHATGIVKDFNDAHKDLLDGFDPTKIDNMRKAFDDYIKSVDVATLQARITELQDLIDKVNIDILAATTTGNLNGVHNQIEFRDEKVEELNVLKDQLLTWQQMASTLTLAESKQRKLDEETAKAVSIIKEYQTKMDEVERQLSKGLISTEDAADAAKALYNEYDKLTRIEFGMSLKDFEETAGSWERVAELMATAYTESVEAIEQQFDILGELHGMNVLDNETYLAKLKIMRDMNKYAFLGKTASELSKNTSSIVNLLSNERLADEVQIYLDIVKEIADVTEDMKEDVEDTVDAYEDMARLAEDSKESMQNLLDMVVEMLEQKYENMIDALEAQTEEYEKQVDLAKEQLKLAEAKHDYERALAEKTSDVADLEAQIAILARDDSLEARAKRLELEEELAEKTEDLAEFQHDRSIELQEDALDQELDRFKAVQDEKIDVLEKMLDEQGRLYAEALDLLNNDFLNGTEIVYQSLLEWNKLYGDSIDENITSAWTSAMNAAQMYGNGTGFLGAMNAAGDSSIINQMRANSSDWWSAESDAERNALNQANKSLASQLSRPAYYDSTSGKWLWADSNVPLYGKGAFVDRPHLAMVGDKEEVILPTNSLMDVINNPNALAKAVPDLSSKIKSATNNGVSGINIESLITINGNVDKDVMGDLKKYGETIIQKTISRINSQFASMGQTQLRRL